MARTHNKSARKGGKLEAVAGSGVEDNPAVYFLSLEVENVRCFGAKQTLDLSDGSRRPAQWTVILGDNGVGKTTLLQCLGNLFIELCIRTRLSVERWYRWEALTSMCRWQSDQARSDSGGFSVRAVTFSGTALASGEAGLEYHVELGAGHEEVHTRKPAGWAEDFEYGYGYGAARRMGQGYFAEKTPSLGVASLFDDDTPLLNAEEWILQADYASSKDSPVRKREEKRRDQIKEILIDILPDVEAIIFTGPTAEQPKPGVRFKTPYGLASIRDLSLGYRTLIAWMVDFASRMFDRYPNSPNPLAEPAVVLVDEIDLHLHPQWQRRLISFLSDHFRNTQFIVTAHSPLVVQAASNANVVLLRREGDHVIIDNNVERIRNWRVDQILTSDLFGLETARPPEIDGLLARRNELLSRGSLDIEALRELEEVERQLGPLPAGDTAADAEALDVIHRAAELLKNRAR